MADLREAILHNTNLSGANFQNASLTGTSFQGANLLNTSHLEMHLLGKAKTLFQAQLDPAVLDQVQQDHPGLLQAPNK